MNHCRFLYNYLKFSIRNPIDERINKRLINIDKKRIIKWTDWIKLNIYKYWYKINSKHKYSNEKYLIDKCNKKKLTKALNNNISIISNIKFKQIFICVQVGIKIKQ